LTHLFWRPVGGSQIAKRSKALQALDLHYLVKEMPSRID